MFVRSLDVVAAVWLQALLGTALLIVAVGVGWAVGREDSTAPVRLIAWWVRRVALPLLTCRSWWRRTATIFANNVVVLAVLLGLGRWKTAALVGVAGLGISLGIGLRVLANEPGAFHDLGARRDRNTMRRVRIGVALNLLEPPAIMLTTGLCLAYRTLPLSAAEAWQTFALWVVPLTMLAAGGEALWLGTYHGAGREHTGDAARPDDTPADP